MPSTIFTLPHANANLKYLRIASVTTPISLTYVILFKSDNTSPDNVHYETINQAYKAAKPLDDLHELKKVVIYPEKDRQKPTPINPHSYDFYFKMLYDAHYKFYEKNKVPYDDAFASIDKNVRRILALKDQ